MNGLSFLCERAMSVKVNDSYFKVHVLKSAVVQGSVLGPMLFNIYIRLFYMFMEHKSFEIKSFTKYSIRKLCIICAYLATSVFGN